MTALLTLNNVSMCFRSKEGQRHTVFDGIDLRLYPSECLAVVGRNGSGKSTLLRVMARILAPTAGSVDWARYDRIAAEPGVRIQQSCPGGIMPFCMPAYGTVRKDAAQSLDSIESFCEIGDFFDQPVRSYSTGMRARLGFGTALMNRSSVILIDETLSVGDAFFRDKARSALQQEFLENRAVVLVSHAERQIKRMSSRVVLLEKGKILSDGDPDSVLKEYAALPAQ